MDARLGGEAAWERLVAAARAHGLALVLDVVLNHVGDAHPWFLEARRDPASPRRSWFTFEEDGRYRCWRGYGHLPELRLEEPSLRRALLEDPEGVVRRWLRRGASGWRIDCANDLGIDFCRELREATAREGAPAGVIGELVSWAAPFLEQGAIDGVMNYGFRDAVLAALTGEVPGEVAARDLERIARDYPRRGLLRSWTMLGSHDTPRLRTVLGGREPVLLALLLAFTYPGVPLVYYGDEIGLEGHDDPDNRRGMIWDQSRWDRETLERVRALARLRRERPALLSGDYVPLPSSPASVIAFARTTGDPRQDVVVLANAGDRPVRARVVLPRVEMFDALPLQCRLDPGRRALVRSGSLRLELPAMGGALLVPEPVDASGYDFFKRV